MKGRVASDKRSQIVTSMNEVNICYVSAWGDNFNVTKSSVKSYINNVNSVPGFDTISIELRDLILPKFKDSENLEPLYFIREFDQYFRLKNAGGTKATFGFLVSKITIFKAMVVERFFNRMKVYKRNEKIHTD